MGLVRYFVLRHGDHWLVTLEGRTMARHPSRAAAIESAIVMADLMGAMHHDADVMVECRDGEPPELVWTYGVDPLPGAEPLAGSQRSHVRHVQRAAAASP